MEKKLSALHMHVHTCVHAPTRIHISPLPTYFSVMCFWKIPRNLLLICILLYRLIPCVMFYCCPCLWWIFSKCSTSDLSLLNHFVDFWPYLLIFKSIWKPDPVLWGAASCSQHCIICWFDNHTAFKSLGLLRKYQIETDLNRCGRSIWNTYLGWQSCWKFIFRNNCSLISVIFVSSLWWLYLNSILLY